MMDGLEGPTLEQEDQLGANSTAQVWDAETKIKGTGREVSY